jgi:hypothetical protein
MADPYNFGQHDQGTSNMYYATHALRRPSLPTLDVTSLSAQHYPYSQPSSAYSTSTTYPEPISGLSVASNNSSYPKESPKSLNGLPLPALTPSLPTVAQAVVSESQELRQKGVKKRNKVREHVPLSLDQPLTTQGKERIRVYLACVQWSVVSLLYPSLETISHHQPRPSNFMHISRNRKIRCDGAKPACEVCSKRGVSECSYDTAPKRRGPDRAPGARQRVPIDSDGKPIRRRRRKSSAEKVPASAAITATISQEERPSDERSMQTLKVKPPRDRQDSMYDVHGESISMDPTQLFPIEGRDSMRSRSIIAAADPIALVSQINCYLFVVR